MSWTKKDYIRRIDAYLWAFRSIAKQLGYDSRLGVQKHPVVQFMGGLAWGRHDSECGVDGDTLRGRAVEYGFLYGCERMLVSFCNVTNDPTSRTVVLDTVRQARDR